MSKVAAILRAHELAKAQKVQRKGTENILAKADREFAENARMYRQFNEDWETNYHPDPIGRHTEPASIYSPAGQSRIKFERPRKRKGRDPLNVGKDCELPDYRTNKTYRIEDAQGRVRGAIEVNQFSKRIRVGGFGLGGKP